MAGGCRDRECLVGYNNRPHVIPPQSRKKPCAATQVGDALLDQSLDRVVQRRSQESHSSYGDRQRNRPHGEVHAVHVTLDIRGGKIEGRVGIEVRVGHSFEYSKCATQALVDLVLAVGERHSICIRLLGSEGSHFLKHGLARIKAQVVQDTRLDEVVDVHLEHLHDSIQVHQVLETSLLRLGLGIQVLGHYVDAPKLRFKRSPKQHGEKAIHECLIDLWAVIPSLGRVDNRVVGRAHKGDPHSVRLALEADGASATGPSGKLDGVSGPVGQDVLEDDVVSVSVVGIRVKRGVLGFFDKDERGSERGVHIERLTRESGDGKCDRHGLPVVDDVERKVSNHLDQPRLGRAWGPC